MGGNTKRIVLFSISANLVVIGLILSYFQFLGNKIVIEPPARKVIVPIADLEEGVVIDSSMVEYRTVFEKDFIDGISDPGKVIGFKSLIKLKKGMQLFPYMLQPPEKQHKKGYFLASVDLVNVNGTVANQVKKNDYVNIMLCIEKDGMIKEHQKIRVADVVLAKRKVLELVNSAGVPEGAFERKDFKTQFIILEMNLNDYYRYKAARLYASRYNGKIELVICDPTQEPIRETFEPSREIFYQE